MIIALNNKSNLDKEQFLEYQEKCNQLHTSHKMIVCPTFLNINLYQESKIHLGAQNVSATGEGAYTGEVSAKDLKKSNVEYCIVGHSERRTYQRETLEEINQKIIQLEENDIIPILCVGESLEERNQNQVKEVIKKEIETAIVNTSKKERIIIAYEPIWSIGTGVIPTNEEIEEVFDYIKELLPNNKILYGGSANENNISTLKQVSAIDGYLLGGLSLKPEQLQIFLNQIEE
jgi:triosephosphate isomerase